jgi:hypothetical protein
LKKRGPVRILFGFFVLVIFVPAWFGGAAYLLWLGLPPLPDDRAGPVAVLNFLVFAVVGVYQFYVYFVSRTYAGMRFSQEFSDLAARSVFILAIMWWPGQLVILYAASSAIKHALSHIGLFQNPTTVGLIVHYLPHICAVAYPYGIRGWQRVFALRAHIPSPTEEGQPLRAGTGDAGEESD